MKKFLFLSFFLLSLSVLQAQKVYFIYLQSDNNTPFYVKMNDKVYSSTSLGYLILSKLKDSTYTFSVGRPTAQTAELRFSVTVNGSDKGFLLRQSDNGYSLFDLLTMATIKPSGSNTGGGLSTTKKTDTFSKMLSEAANDTSLLEVSVTAEDKKTRTDDSVPQKKEADTKTSTVVQTQTVEKDTIAMAAKTNDTKTDSKPQQELPKTETPPATIAASTPLSTVPPANSTSGPENINIDKQVQTSQAAPAEQINYKRSVVTRRSESSTSEGFGLVYLDNQDGVVDTIRLLIPNSKIVLQQETELKKEEAATTTSNSTVKQNPLCQVMASENDFLRLRKDMAAENSENNMIDEARKVFRKKCFTTEQIRNLSTLFLTAEGKYNFFDAAYRHTSDPGQFATLETELKNENYVRRFKALVGR